MTWNWEQPDWPDFLYDSEANPRQEKVAARMFKEGVDGFAQIYISTSGTSRANATRDLQDLAAKGAVTRTGELRHTRYFLNLEQA